MPPVATLDEVTVRVLADNPSPMTLDGTNTYVLGAPGSGAAVLVDPGPDDPTHWQRVQDVLADRDASVDLVLVTHHHLDHAEAAQAWAGRLGARVAAASPAVAGPDGRVLADDETVEVAGLTVTAIATPGHCADHLAFRLATGALLSGDHVLGRGTSVVAHPDGDLSAYLASLRRTLELGPEVLYPGHGPALTEDPGAVLAFYRDHRGFRAAQILALLEGGPATPRALVEVIYAALDPVVWDAAEASTRAALAMLADDGEVEARDGLWRRVS